MFRNYFLVSFASVLFLFGTSQVAAETTPRQFASKISKAQIAVELDQGQSSSFHAANQLSFTVDTIDGPVTIYLQPHDVRGGNFRAQRQTKQGSEKDTGSDRVRMYRGTLSTQKKKDFARLTFLPGTDSNSVTISGVIRAHGRYYSVDSKEIFLTAPSINNGDTPGTAALRSDTQSAPDADIVVTEMMPSDGEVDTCGAGSKILDTIAPQVSLEAPLEESSTLLSSMNVTDPVGTIGFLPITYGKRAVLPIATEADYEYTMKRGGAAAANAFILSTVNAVDGIYQAELGLAIEVVFQNAWEVAADPYASPEARMTLIEFVHYWNANFRAKHPYAIAHIFTAKDGSGFAGVALGYDICSATSYSLSRNYIEAGRRALILAHELGHNLGADHDSRCDGTNVMCPSVQAAATKFSTASKSSMNKTNHPIGCITPEFENSSELMPVEDLTAKSQVVLPRSGGSPFIELKWGRPQNHWQAKAYNLYRTTSTTTSPCEGTLLSKETKSAEYWDSTINVGTVYRYGVRPVGWSGSLGACSNIASGSVTYAQVPYFTLQPSSADVNIGDRATFTAKATDPLGRPLTYQWYTRTSGAEVGSSQSWQGIAGATAASYQTQAVTITDTGRTFKVVAKSGGYEAHSNEVALRIPSPSAFLSHPKSLQVFAGQSASFSCEVQTRTNSAPEYSWQRNRVNIPEANGATYVRKNVTVGDHGSKYRCVALPLGSEANLVAISNEAELTVYGPPVVVNQPTNKNVANGSSASFSVTATGEALRYQWMRDGAIISNATDSTYTIPAVDAGASGKVFSVLVSNPAGTVISSGATLTVTSTLAAPTITSQPQSATVRAGSGVTFQVSATGLSLTYRWYRNGKEIAGATGPAYTLQSLGTVDNGSRFHVVVSNAAGSVTSQSVLLTVETTPETTTVFVNDAIPTTATASGSWRWVTTPRHLGNKAHQSAIGTNTNTHSFVSATRLAEVPKGAVFFTYVYLDKRKPAAAIMLQVRDGQGSWSHRAYWGANIIGYGRDNTAARRSMGRLPAKGAWYRLEVPASAIDLEGKAVHGIAFTVKSGVATFDRTGMTGAAAR